MHGQVEPIHKLHALGSTEQPPPLADQVWLGKEGRQAQGEAEGNGHKIKAAAVLHGFELLYHKGSMAFRECRVTWVTGSGKGWDCRYCEKLISPKFIHDAKSMLQAI